MSNISRFEKILKEQVASPILLLLYIQLILFRQTHYNNNITFYNNYIHYNNTSNYNNNTSNYHNNNPNTYDNSTEWVNCDLPPQNSKYSVKD